MSPVLGQAARQIRRSGANPATQPTRGDHWDSYLRGRGYDDWTRDPVTDEQALGLTAFYRGVSLISSSIAALPIDIFRESEDKDGRDVRTKAKTPETRYLWGRPNPEMRRMSFWERVFADELRGNAFIFVVNPDGARIRSIWWIDRRRVRVGRNSNGVKVYEIDRELPMIDYRAGGEIVHIPNWGGALTGYDPVDLASEAIRLGLSAEEYAARHFESPIPPGLLSTDQELTVPQANEISERWAATHNGMSMSQKIAVLGRGTKFQPTVVDHEKMQMEALRRFQVEEIARLLGLYPHQLADASKGTTWGGGIEQQNIAFVQDSLLPHAVRVEEGISEDLLVNELTGLRAKWNFAGRLRGSMKERNEAYTAADYLSPDEKRALEDLPPVGGKAAQLWMPVNKMPIDAPAFSGEQAATAQPVGAGTNG